MRKNIFVLVSLVILASMLLAACAPAAPTPATVVKTVVVTEKVEVAGTPQIVEKVITATPPPAATEAPLKAVHPEFKNPDTFVVIDGAGEQETLDPAWTYETRGSGIEANIYEGLTWWNKDNPSDFIPALATEWKTSADGLQWDFTIRKGVTFHEGGTLEPHDVAYTIQRDMLQGRTDGPEWIAYEAFFGPDLAMASSKDFAAALEKKKTFEELTPAQVKDACDQIQSKVVADDTAGTVTLHLTEPTPWMLAITASNFLGAIVDKEWMVQNGDWDGTCDNWTDRKSVV